MAWQLNTCKYFLESRQNINTWLTLLRGDTSTACLLTVPARPIRVESSRGPELMMAWTRIWRGLSPVRRWMISKLCFTILTVNSFLPLFLPCIIRLFTRRSTMGHWALRNLLAAYLRWKIFQNLVKIFHSIKCLPASGVGKKLGELLLDGDVVLEGHVGHLDVLAAPLPEQLDLGDLGEDGGRGLHLGHRLVGPIISHLDSGFILLKPNRRFT